LKNCHLQMLQNFAVYTKIKLLDKPILALFSN
jgi:hypothetical protein